MWQLFLGRKFFYEIEKLIHWILIEKQEHKYLGEQISRSEKEIKKLDEKFTKSNENDEKEKIRKLIKMEETTLNRMKKEIYKYKGKYIYNLYIIYQQLLETYFIRFFYSEFLFLGVFRIFKIFLWDFLEYALGFFGFLGIF